jgi:hypothetical protein
MGLGYKRVLEPPNAQSRDARAGSCVNTSLNTSLNTSSDEPDDNAMQLLNVSAFHRLQLRWDDGWAAEIVSYVFAVVAIACLVSTLRYFDGSVVTEVPLKIPINTLVAILVGVAKSSLLLPVAEG